MKTEQLIFTESEGWKYKKHEKDCQQAGLVLVFGSSKLLREIQNIEFLRAKYPVAKIIGCSSAGELCRDEVRDSSLICTAIKFEKTDIRVEVDRINHAGESFSIGRKLAGKLNTGGLAHILIFSEGLNINGSELTNGLNSILEDQISVTGGLAGDQSDFNETVLVYNDKGEKNLIIAIGFYGKNIRIGYGSMGGWESFGVDRLVTKSKANILYELDGQKALELYKKYLGPHAAKLPASALLFPLNLRFKDSNTVLVRTVLSVDDKEGSMTFAGDIPEGEYVRLMKSGFEKLVSGAEGAAEMSLTSLGVTEPELALLISCVGRKLVLKQRVEEEVEAVQEKLSPGTTISGFYSNGEICPISPFKQRCELHNQTMTVTLFKEI